MIYITLNCPFRGNKAGFISASLEESLVPLMEHLDNWDVEYTDDELENIYKAGSGILNEKEKTYVEVNIAEVREGQTIDLR